MKMVDPEGTKAIIEMSKSEIDRVFRESNKKYFGDESKLSIGDDITNLGILGLTESVHQGFIIPVKRDGKKRHIGAGFNYTFIKGMRITFYVYERYEDLKTIIRLLRISTQFSDSLAKLNGVI